MPSQLRYLIGTSGNPNYGDELITAAWLRFLADVAPEDEVWLDCPQPGSAATLFHGLHPRLTITNTLWRAAIESAHLGPEAAVERVASLVTGFGSPSYDLGLLRLRDAASLHLIGGGYLNAVWPHHAALIAGAAAVRQLTGAELYATGQGLMPAFALADTDRDALFAGFTSVSARDAPSAEAFGVSLGLDDAFLAAADDRARRLDPDDDALVVCLQHDMIDDDRFDHGLAVVRRHVEAARRAGRPVRYVEAIPGSDRDAFVALDGLVREDEFVPFLQVWQEGLAVGPRQQWVTSRFHLHLMAASAGAAGVAIPVKRGYYDIKHRSLVDLGTGWALADEEADPDMPTAAGPLAASLPQLVARKHAEALSLHGPVPATE